MDDLEHLKPFLTDSNDALHIKLIRKAEDINDDSITFHPFMTHQFFGEREHIFGYKELEIKLYYSADDLIPYLGVTYSKKVNCLDLEADDFLPLITKFLQPGFFTNLDDYSKIFEKTNNFIPFGELITSFKIKEKCYEIFHADVNTPGFKNYHERLQTFILFYIDAASFIDTDDDRWNFFVIYEKYKENGKNRYSIIGYSTIYNYYAYPDKIRPRISQMLILPPFQKQGLGGKLLNAIYDYYKNDKNITDITVEDPSLEFQRLRDYVDVINCKKYFSKESLSKKFNKEIGNKIKEETKLSKKQIRRVFEILKLGSINTKNSIEYKKYRLEVKNRLNIPHQRESIYLQRLLKVCNIEEIRTFSPILSKDQRLKKLEHDYNAIESHYQHILSRLEEST